MIAIFFIKCVCRLCNLLGFYKLSIRISRPEMALKIILFALPYFYRQEIQAEGGFQVQICKHVAEPKTIFSWPPFVVHLNKSFKLHEI